MRCPKSRFPIRIIVFDELELIIFVSQGLTLSTASLVGYYGSQEKNVSASLAIFIYLLKVPDKLIFPKKEWSGVKHQLRIAVTELVKIFCVFG